jgi:hypothetical protein
MEKTAKWRVAKMIKAEGYNVNGHPVLRVRVKLLESYYKLDGKKVQGLWAFLSLEPKRVWKLAQMFEALELPLTTSSDTKLLAGRYCKVLVDVAIYSIAQQVVVRQFRLLNEPAPFTAESLTKAIFDLRLKRAHLKYLSAHPSKKGESGYE